MKRVELSLPQFGFIVATRAALGAGVALLLTNRLRRRTREKLGRALLAFGAATTVPAARFLFRRNDRTAVPPAASSAPAPPETRIGG